jgi:hypothetical protein
VALRDQAHRVRFMIGQVMRFAVATGRAERDPGADLKGALAPPVRGHYAAPTDPNSAQKLQAIRCRHKLRIFRCFTSQRGVTCCRPLFNDPATAAKPAPTVGPG